MPPPTNTLTRAVLRRSSRWPTITTNLVSIRLASNASEPGSTPRFSHRVTPSSLPQAEKPGKAGSVPSAAPSSVSSSSPPARDTSATSPDPSGQSSDPPGQSYNIPSKKQLTAGTAAGGAVLIVIVGTLTGAVLKQDTDTARRVQELRESPIDEQLATLRSRRAYLVEQQAPFKRKLDNLRARKAASSETSGAETNEVPKEV